MRTDNRRVAVVAGNRIPFARQDKTYRHASNSDMLTAALNGLVDRIDLAARALGEVVAGAVLKHARDWNMVREVVLGSKLAPRPRRTTSSRPAAPVSRRRSWSPTRSPSARSTPASRAASTPRPTRRSRSTTDLRSILLDLNRAKTLPGSRSGSLTRVRPKDVVPEIPRNAEPRTGKSMGDHAALTALEWGITREAQDELAYRSHINLAARLRPRLPART